MRTVTPKTGTRTAIRLCFALFVLVALLVPLSSAGAAEEQALQAVGSYVNPITNEIEDIGNNPGLGQGMVENTILKTPASLLVDDEGSTFITMRVGLVKESQDFALELLDASGKAVEAIPYSVVAEQPDENTQDIQFKVPSIDSILRVSLISKPMQREVVAFVQFAPEGEMVEIPTAIETEVDDSAITINENSKNDEVTGVDEETRGQILQFLAIAVGVLVGFGAAFAFVTKRKKRS